MTSATINRLLALAGPIVIVLLLAVRLPSLVEPMGGDQGLYSYVGQTILAGGVPVKDAFDQKPPAIHFLYALMWRIDPHESVVAAADLVAAALVAWLLVVIGRRVFTRTSGDLAACAFLLFGNPAFQRYGGMYVRSQCETFIALAMAAALALVAARSRHWTRLFAAGVCLGIAIWLKYNAAAYALPLVAAAAWWTEHVPSWKRLTRHVLWIGAGAALVTAIAVVYFAAHGALMDVRLATIDYNLRYSAETYSGLGKVLLYPFELPFDRARDEALWYLGGIGALLIALRWRDRRTRVVLTWLAAAVLSIAINGARDLPQYFVQANPALGLAAGVGVAMLASRARWQQAAAVVLVLAGLWRVGDEPPGYAPRWFGLPGAAANVASDLEYLQGRISRDVYLARFGGQGPHDKFSALAVEQLATYVTQTTTPSDSILVFGFSSGAVYVKSHRRASSRFFWSRPVMLDFAGDRPGYGVAGLLDDLRRDPPALVVLQRQDWGSPGDVAASPNAEQNSFDFFMRSPVLHAWLDAGYTHDRSTPIYDIWRKRS